MAHFCPASHICLCLIPHFYLLFTVHTFYGIYILKQMTFYKISVWFFFFYSVWSTYVAFHEIMVATDPGHSNVTWGNLNIWFTGQSVYFQHRRKERFFFTWKVSVFRRLNKSVNESDLMQKKKEKNFCSNKIGVNCVPITLSVLGSDET